MTIEITWIEPAPEGPRLRWCLTGNQRAALSLRAQLARDGITARVWIGNKLMGVRG